MASDVIQGSLSRIRESLLLVLRRAWIGATPAEQLWLEESTDESREALNGLLEAAGCSPLEWVITIGSDRPRAPSADRARALTEGIFRVCEDMKTSVADVAEEDAIRTQAVHLMGLLFADVLWPLYRAYPELAPPDLRGI